MDKIKKISTAIGLVIFALFFYFTGYVVGHKNLVFEQNYRPKIANKELYKPKEVDFSPFWTAWDKIMNKYAGEADPQKMVYGAISGMVDSLGDPYSSFMAPDESQDFFNELSGEVEGIGAEISVVAGKLTIISPIAGSPAEKAGLKPNDQILKVDGQDTGEMTLDQAINKIRGKANTKVKLTVLRKDWTEPKDFEIERQKIQVKSVEWQMKEDNIDYIKISKFGDDTVDLVKNAANEIDKKNPKAIILDLRSNPGGYLNGAINVASLFMDKGVVVKEKSKDGGITEEKTTLDPI